MGTTEVVQALVSPAEKLIEAVSGAIGKAYEPRHIKKMADAKAYELKMISDAVRNNSDVPIVYDSTGVSIDTSNFEEIAKRASSRLAYQEITKQQNIESVVDNAYQELQGAEAIQDTQVDPDWMFRFFNAVENISNEDMQKIWGRILAGEIQSPSKYSYRTLEKMRNITQSEALLFQKVAALAIREGSTTFILSEETLMNKHDVYFADLLILEECGMMSSQTLSLTISVSSDNDNIIFNSKILGKITGTKSETEKIILYIYIFTEAGVQLIDAIQPEQNETYIIECLEYIREQQKEKAVITAHQVNYIDADGKISYNRTDILPAVQIEA